MTVKVVFLGDDFTGASDSLATYAGYGWQTGLALKALDDTGMEGLDALGLPTDLRSLAPNKASAKVSALWPQIARADPQILHFKVCSTFDSASDVGSIGHVANELIARFKPDVIAIIGGQPSLGRYCAFGHLFAKGPDGNIHRIDRHPVMSRHPVTPMKESDLRLHLEAQGIANVQLLPVTALDDDERIDHALRQGPVLFDVMCAGDQHKIAKALQRAGGRQLLIGASSVAEILAGTLPKDKNSGASDLPKSSNILLFAGSRSANTAAQIEASTAFTKLALTPDALSSGSTAQEAAALFDKGKPVLVHLDPDAEYGLCADALADASSAFVLNLMNHTDVGYLGLAGGDTSSRICQQLGFNTLKFEESLGSGVCICSAAHDDPSRDNMRIMLKGGQMGAPDLFDRFAQWAGTP